MAVFIPQRNKQWPAPCLLRPVYCAAYVVVLGLLSAEIAVRVDLARGNAVATVWICDFSYDYVKINAEYRT